MQMALKNWKKVKGVSGYQWKKDSKKGVNYISTYSSINKWEVWLFKEGQTKRDAIFVDFETKPEALAYAKKYMKSH